VDIVTLCILNIFLNHLRKACLNKCSPSILIIRRKIGIEALIERRREKIRLMKAIVKFYFNLVGDRTSEERRRIIGKWNKKFEREKDDERRKREAAEAKINFILIQQRIQENMNQKKNENSDNKD
jgi:hypothetical protein